MEGPEYFGQILANMDADDGSILRATAIASAVGFLEYFYCVYPTHKDGRGPFPLWMYLFYLAHDSTWCYLLAQEAPKYNNHIFLTGTSKGLALWSALEIYCTYRLIVVEREGLFSRSQSATRRFQAYIHAALLLLVFYGTILSLIYMVGRQGWMQWTIFTNMVMAVGPGALWLERGSRRGTSLGLAAVIIVGTVNSFTPYSQWVLAVPEIFDNNLYYGAGVACTLYSVYNFYIVASLPEDDKSGKKA
ncbi:hypothetical protein ACJQWK_10595 [Exserohilum turcicum]|uniref:Uncharacterized protein n=1 Tax=Exserohilum turcicum (strain 28A) TaxID=671987 RepID=R0JZW1_EXST2|nr:uncharacterized protein SETTUDRAFT_24114 [Exserohilum turcica Et28A]EOA81727.1 hypothetical protein SETTUDRAFT_24114 [Exserohilum turcica Et28A]